ncbi:MAG TPA: Ti-type conjugative transfer relaxase TraA [Gammaproteobacteria bacterium]|nr:Ti-type conjugative transfer relaxase TraA [Gammaproteobacteria bacterium]HRA42602.1 Ti-type conjugative transfer relaxase TraA [Gammaproteobacteria bacterium]
MAIYHFSGTVISRSQGRSAIACAAYRSGERLMDERYEKIQDYSRKDDIVHEEILLPKNAPEWMGDREKLWNAVEAAEKRKDAQLAREFNFALPQELTLQQNLELARAFVKEQFVKQGMVADLCIHEDMKDGESLLHAHIMLTLREVTPEGFGYKVRDWNSKAQLLNWREAWANTANHFLALNGHDRQIDHRTLEAQGINLEPQYKIGASTAQDRMARLEDHQRIARENGERLFKNPDEALDALTKQQSTFSYQDLARFVNRQTVDAEQFERVYEKVKGHSNIVHLGLDDRGIERFTSREMLGIETKMLEHTRLLSQCDGHFVKIEHKLQAIAPRTLSGEQKEAFHHLLEPYDLRCVIGYAGTGKSYLLEAAREAWEASGYRVHGVTLSGIAAENLEGSSGIESRTLASRSWYWDRGEQLLGRKDILVVDEAGMLGSRQMARILEVADQGNAKVVLVGDTQQLQAIEAGAAFRAIIEQTGALELTEVRRQRVPWQAEATKDFARGHTAKALGVYEANHVHVFETQALARAAVVEMWNDARLTNSNQTQIMLAYTRVDVQALNDEARTLRHAEGELGLELEFKTERGKRLFAVNDRVYFLKNDKALGVTNGTLGAIESVKEGQIIVRLDEGDKKDINDDRKVIVDLNLYKHLEHGYAATVYKTQGVTVDRSYVLASRHLDAHATYVGMSRHRESVDLFWSKEAFPRMESLIQTLSRQRGKDVSTDYENMQDFAKGRGVEPIEPQREQTGIEAFKAQFEVGYPERVADKVEHKPFVHPLQNLRRSFKHPMMDRQARSSLDTFKERYEAANPEKAAAIQDKFISPLEREALSFIKRFDSLENRLATGKHSDAITGKLQKEARAAFANPELMDYLKTKNVGLSEKVQKLAEPQKTLEMTKGLERDFGLER